MVKAAFSSGQGGEPKSRGAPDGGRPIMPMLKLSIGIIGLQDLSRAPQAFKICPGLPRWGYLEDRCMQGQRCPLLTTSVRT